MTKSEADIAANKLLSMMKSKGWKKKVWENLGWHYSIELPIKGTSGGASISPDYYGNAPYFCMISTTHLGCGEQGLYDDKSYDDPNEAFDNSLRVFEKLANFLNQIKKTAYI